MSSTAPAPEVFYHLCLAADAPMGQSWLLSTRIPLLEVALNHLALESKSPSIAKAREANGHFCTTSQMNKVPRQYLKPELDLTTSLEQASQLLNPQPAPTHMVRLSSLHMEAIRRILLVTQQYAPDWMQPTCQGAPSWTSGEMKWCSHHLVSQPTQPSTAHLWQQPRAFLEK
jgi:hypothetical protein